MTYVYLDLDSCRLVQFRSAYFLWIPQCVGYWRYISILQLSAFIKCIVYDFNKRVWSHRIYQEWSTDRTVGWHEEQKPDCKTPTVCKAWFASFGKLWYLFVSSIEGSHPIWNVNSSKVSGLSRCSPCSLRIAAQLATFRVAWSLWVSWSLIWYFIQFWSGLFQLLKLSWR